MSFYSDYHEPDYSPDEEPRPCTIILTCNRERIDEDKVEFLGISEDFQGADILEFRCPRCGQTHTSRRYG